MIRFRNFIPVVTLAWLVACGGGSGRKSFTAIQYMDPASTNWRLVKDASSTNTHLVLNLVGPTGTKARGVALTLQGDTDYIQFAKFPGGSYLKDAGVFKLTVNNTDEPKLVIGGVKNNELMLGIFQKGLTQPAQDCGKTLLQCCLDLKPDIPAFQSPVVSLKVIKAQILPETVATLSMATPGSCMQSIPVEMGTVVLR